MEAVVLDPLAPSPRGMWSGQGVQVRRRRGPHRPHGDPDAVCTPRFCVQRRGRLLAVEHDLTPDELCDELAVMLAEQLVDAGALRGQPEFELVFTGIVRSTVDGGLPAWLRFYRNSWKSSRAAPRPSPRSTRGLLRWCADTGSLTSDHALASFRYGWPTTESTSRQQISAPPPCTCSGRSVVSCAGR